MKAMTPPDHTLEEIHTMMQKVHAARESFRLRRADRAERVQLKQGIGGHLRPSEQKELEAILESSPLEETRDLWVVLAQRS
jgi:hypothetical protein